MKARGISPEFVEFIPSTLVKGILYISETYKTAAHLCCCGCGIKIVTPINETGWSLTRKGGRVTLHPSIGNWNHPCQSHYWIKCDRVVWSGTMTPQEIARGRTFDRARSDAYFAKNIEVKVESGSKQSPPKLSGDTTNEISDKLVKNY